MENGGERIMNKERIERLRKELLSMVDKPKPMCDIVAWNYSIAFSLRILKLVEIDKTISELTEDDIKNFFKDEKLDAFQETTDNE